jgi:hypothetical protein
MIRYAIAAAFGLAAAALLIWHIMTQYAPANLPQ